MGFTIINSAVEGIDSMANNLKDMMDFFVAQRKRALGSYVTDEDGQQPDQSTMPSQVDNSPVTNSGATNPQVNSSIPSGGSSDSIQPMANSNPVENIGISSSPQNVGISLNPPANAVPQSALSYNSPDSSVMRRYMMGRQGVFTTESPSMNPSSDVITSPTANTSRYTSAGDNTVSTSPDGQPSTGTMSQPVNQSAGNQPSDGGLDFNSLGKSVQELHDLAMNQPQFNKEQDPNPANYKRKAWKNILYAMANNLKNANPALVSTPGGFLGALVGGAAGGAITKTPVSNPDYQTPTNLGAYGQALYNQAQAGVDSRNQSRFQDYQVASQAHDKKIGELTNVVHAGESVVNAQATQEYKRQMEQQRKDQNDIRLQNLANANAREARLNKQAEQRETARQYLRDHPKTSPVKIKLNGTTVLGAYNPTAPEGQNITPIKDAKGNYIEAPDDAMQVYEAKAQAAAAAANVPMPHAEELLTQAEQEVQGMKDYRDLNEDEIQRRVTSIYNAKLKDAETQYKAQQGSARAAGGRLVRRSAAGGGNNLPSDVKSIRDSVRETRKKLGLQQ